MTSRIRPPLGRGSSPPIALTLVVAGCSAAPASSRAVPGPPAATGTETATAQPGATPSPTGGMPPVEHCGASTSFQLAYDLPGMEAVEVTCDITYKQIDGLGATLEAALAFLRTHLPGH